MNIQAKKIIAREFLILLGNCLISTLTFVGIYFYASYMNKIDRQKIAYIERNITKADSIDKIIASQDPFTKYGGHEINHGNRKINLVKQSSVIRTEVDNLVHEEHLYKLKIPDENSQVQFAINAAIILLICLFGIRYTYYAVLWSVKIIKL